MFEFDYVFLDLMIQLVTCCSSVWDSSESFVHDVVVSVRFLSIWISSRRIPIPNSEKSS